MNRKKILVWAAGCAAALILAVLVLTSSWFLRGLGRFLACEAEPTYSESIVVLSGETAARLIEAIDLYHRNLGDEIILTQEPTPRIAPIFKRLGLPLSSDPEVLKQAAVKLGVPEEAVIIIPTPVLSTREEAQEVKKFLEQNKRKSLTVVTSNYHKRRTKYIFTKIMKPAGISVYVHGSKYDDIDMNNWWKNRRDMRRVVFEFQKWLLYHILY